MTVASVVLILYLATPTAHYYWDGLAFASKIEEVAAHSRSMTSLFHQNHLIYNVIGYVLYRLPISAWLHVRALYVLQLASAFSGAVGVGLFFGIARRLFRSLFIATIASAALAVSACWWKAATDADAYSLSVMLVLLCASILLGTEPRWYWAGMALAGAMLVHELAALSYPAMIASIGISSIKNKLGFAVKLSLLAWGMTVLSYCLVGALAFGISNPLGTMRWAASNPYGVSFSNPFQTLATFPKYQLDLVFGHSFKAFRMLGGATELGLAFAGLVAALVSVKLARHANTSEAEVIRPSGAASRDAKRLIVPVILAWAAPYMLFLLIWEPYLLHYRVYYVPPVVLGLALALIRSCRRAGGPRRRAAGLAVAALGLWNMAFFIAPYMHRTSDPLVAAAKDANSKWNDRTIVYFAPGSLVDGAFRYFNDKTEWRSASPKILKKLDHEIEEIHSRGGNVWLNDTAIKLAEPEWLIQRARGQQLTIRLGDQSYHYVELLPRD